EPRPRRREVSARAGNQIVHAGDLLAAPAGQALDFDLRVTAAAGGTVRWLKDGQQVAIKTGAAVTSADQSFPLAWVSDGRRHWFRAEVMGAGGKMWLLGNPVYIN